MIHSLFESTAATTIWNHSELACLLLEAPTVSFATRWLWMAQKVKAEEFRTIAALISAAWTCKSKADFENETPDPVRGAGVFIKLVDEYRSYSNKVYPQLPRAAASSASNKLSKPPNSMVKVNEDAHVIDGVQVGLGVMVLWFETVKGSSY